MFFNFLAVGIGQMFLKLTHKSSWASQKLRNSDFVSLPIELLFKQCDEEIIFSTLSHKRQAIYGWIFADGEFDKTLHSILE